MNQCILFLAFVAGISVTSADLGSSSPAYGACLCVTASRLNIRTGAGTSYRIIGVANNGECFKYTEQKARGSGFYWYRVDYKGQAAWAAGKYLVIGSPSQCPAGPPEGSCMCVTASRLNMRFDASTSSRIYTTVDRGQCYKYTGQRQSGNGFFWLSLNVNGQEVWAAERYLRVSPSSTCAVIKKKDTYEGCTGSGTVDYRSFKLSDPRTRSKLNQIAEYFCTRLWLTSGDRSRTGTSLHNVGRAGDFWMDGFDPYTEGQKIWDGLRASGLLNDEGWEVIWHGVHTCTGGIHFHVGRYGYPRKTCFKMEGTTSSNVCDYRCHPL